MPTLTSDEPSDEHKMEGAVEEPVRYIAVTDDVGVRRLPDDVFIPNDSRNRDWAAYQQWVAEGNKAEPAAETEVARPKPK
jgi:hypothetical protein